MCLLTKLFSAILITAIALPAQAQSSGPQSLAGTLGIYVFPEKGQDASQQSEDEADCYRKQYIAKF